VSRSLRAKFGLALLLGTAVGCGTEQVEPDVVFLKDPSRSQAENAWLELAFLPDDTVSAATPYGLRIDGRLLLLSPQDRTQLLVSPGHDHFLDVDTLAGTPHVFELVAPSGEAVLTTAPLPLAQRQDNQLLIYGASSDLRYYYFPTSAWELAALADGEVLVNVVNLDPGRRAMDVHACMALGESIADCTPITSALAFGQLWQGTLSAATMLADRCAGSDAPASCYYGAYALVCLPAPSSADDIVGHEGEYQLGGRGYQHLETCHPSTD
jgi:hypothetical protein